jgi:signal transduction histidine kinase
VTHEAGRSARPHLFPRRTLALFALAVILPGAALAVLGVVTLRQDRSLAAQQLRERRDILADRAVAALEAELQGWNAALSASAPASSVDSSLLPPALRNAIERSEAAALVAAGPVGVTSWPPRRLLYELSGTPVSGRPPSPELRDAERIELQERDLVRAEAVYRRLLEAADSPSRAAILIRLARTLAKAGRDDLAAAARRELGRLPGTSEDGVPLDLLAGTELCLAETFSASRSACAQSLYGELVDGTWRLDRVWYWGYSERLRDALDHDTARADAASRLAAREADKRALTMVAESLVSEASGAPARGAIQVRAADERPFVVMSTSPSGGRRAIVLPVSSFSEIVLTAVFKTVQDEAEVSVTAADGTRLFPAGPHRPTGPADAASVTAARLLATSGAGWRIDVTLRNSDAILAGYRLRQWLYVAMLAVMIAALVVGSVLTVRTVSRELAVARLKSQFVSAVSHEFRTPLTGIRHYGEMLLHDRVATEERKHHYYGQVVGAAERLSRLVEDVLDFARMEEGRQEYKTEPIETSSWLRRTASEFQAALTADRRVECTIPDVLPPLRGDGAALTRAVHNLLDNAVKYSPASPVVWLSARAEAGQVLIDVRDEGVGIPRDEQVHVFDRFFRGRQTASSTRGTGLGLSLVQHIVSAHGGRYSLSSEPGRGTTVSVALPAWEQEL